MNGVGEVSAHDGDLLMSWWLAVPSKRARLPTWDVAAECTVAGRSGLLLVEAKAHDREPDESGKREGNRRNHEHIGAAIAAASDGLNRVMPGWRLYRDRQYQLCNRFAWAWKLALLRVPVILVFLGVLDAEEMASSQRRTFSSLDDWRTVLLKHARGIVPEAAWGCSLDVEGTPLVPLIRSVRQGFEIE